MVGWRYREELSRANRMRRSYYELLRDELDQAILNYGLVDSYQRFKDRQVPYPFVERRELKPRARIPSLEYEYQNAFLVLFIEDTIPAVHKKYIRFFDENKTTKTNLSRIKAFSVADDFDRSQKYLESPNFFEAFQKLLPVDYALLIQRDPASRLRDRYSISHFHVKIDWPIADAAEDLARSLRYISKDIYEKGDKYADDIQKKFFEYYGLPVMVGGRRSAAIVAAQYLKRLGCICTVYVSSSESRAVMRITERGISRTILVKLSQDEMAQIAETHQMTVTTFKKNYVVAREGTSGICLFQASYGYTAHSRPPEDGKLREIKSDLHWLTVNYQFIVPRPGVWKYPPLGINLIYA